MTEALKWIAANWPKVPRTLRVIVLFILGSGALGVGLGVGFLAWKSGYIEERLGMVATSKDLEQQTAAITGHVDDTDQRVRTIVNASLQQYTDSLAMVRTDVEETMAKPILQNIIALKAQVRVLMQAQDITNNALEDQRNTAEATTRELLRRIESRPEDNTAEVLLQIQEQLQVIQEQLPQRKVTKGKF